MDKEVARQRYEAMMNADYVSVNHQAPNLHAPPDARSAHALEYIAYQLGKIRQHLEKGNP